MGQGKWKLWERGLILVLFILNAVPVSAQNFANTAGDLKEDEATSEAEEIIMIPAEEADLEALNTPSPVTNEEFSSDYTLGKSDVIEVKVQRHPEVSGLYAINNEGKIQYEFVGDVKVEGLKKEEVKAKLTELLSEYIVSPEVTVKIAQYNSKIVYVIGEVGRPGKIFMRGDTITVREALVQAGLPLLSASTRKSRLFTPSEAGKPKQQRVDVYALLFEGDLRENKVMKPGDTLYVPPTGLTKVMRAIQPVTAPITNAAGAGRTVTTGF